MSKQQKAVVTIVGIDRKGVISSVSTLLANENINILDISQTIVDEYFSMIMVVDITEAKSKIQELSEKCSALGESIGMKITCQHEDIFKYMHNV